MALPPCSNSANLLSSAMVVFIVPFIAALYCIMQLLYRSIFGIDKIFKTDDYTVVTQNKMIFGYGIFWMLFFTIVPILMFSASERLGYIIKLFEKYII